MFESISYLHIVYAYLHEQPLARALGRPTLIRKKRKRSEEESYAATT